MKPLSKYMHAGDRRAFTIIELLVAVGVTALMVSLMLTIVVNVLNGWSRSSGSLTAGNQARFVLDQIGRDLESAIIQRDLNVWIAANIQQDQFNEGSAGVVGADWSPRVPKPSASGSNDVGRLGTSLLVPLAAGSQAAPAIDDYRFGQGGVWLRFFTTVSDTNEEGTFHRLSSPRAVSYQIIRLPVVQGSKEVRYQLFRSEVRPGHTDPVLANRSTFAAGYDLLDPQSLYNTPNNQTDRQSRNFGVLVEVQNGEAVDQGGEPGSIRRPDRSQIIANNIIDFGVRFWARNPTSQNMEVVFPKNVADLSFAATASPNVNVTTKAFPEVAEVFVRVLTDEGVELISNLENGLTPNEDGKWWEIALANSRVYTRRVEIKGTSL